MPKFDAFKADFVKLGFSSSRAADFINKLSALGSQGDSIERPVAQVQPVQSATVGSVAAANPFTVQVSTSKVFSPGQYVSYHGTSLELASVATGNRANWIVLETGAGVVTLAKWVAEMDVSKTGTGTDGSGLLYLYLDGGVTLDQNQIIDSEGVPVVDGYFLQIVGSFNGLSPTSAPSGYVRGAVNVFSDVA